MTSNHDKILQGLEILCLVIALSIDLIQIRIVFIME